MGALVFNATTAALMVIMFNGGLELLGRGTLRGRRVPWAAVGLTALALAGVLAQLCWSGAMDALDDDPAKNGWWRVVTAVFMQNGGLLGGAWNIATLAAVAALADWYWGGPRTLVLFLAGVLLPERADALLGLGGHHDADPRNFAGSSGATYFLGATLAAALLVRALRARRAGTADAAAGKELLLAAGVPVLGLALWFAQANGHGLVSCYGFVLGALALCLPGRPTTAPAAAPAPAAGSSAQAPASASS
ncbi:hypothetical protein ACGFXC_29020 [Streptomyces sp. NPDC048507]|uniref:hypothetical protein n=1 Tax=Streptomyces sp. NPDC048507 TaxID=3365560 RepID=UPI003723C14D